MIEEEIVHDVGGDVKTIKELICDIHADVKVIKEGHAMSTITSK